jgi:hypothetical chaperone protein
MRQRANEHFGCNVRRVVLGRPAVFSTVADNDALAERRLRGAAALAGFEHVDFCPEPVAAARDFQSRLDSPKLILLADFGGIAALDLTLERAGVSADEVDLVCLTGGTARVPKISDALRGANGSSFAGRERSRSARPAPFSLA